MPVETDKAQKAWHFIFLLVRYMMQFSNCDAMIRRQHMVFNSKQ